MADAARSEPMLHQNRGAVVGGPCLSRREIQQAILRLVNWISDLKLSCAVRPTVHFRGPKIGAHRRQRSDSVAADELSDKPNLLRLSHRRHGPSDLRKLSGVPVGSVTRHRSAPATGAGSASHATASSGTHRPTSISQSLEGVLDRTPYFKRNSGGCVIFGWNCALQDSSSQASHNSALRLIASGK
jgi:hypothetical protein